MTDTRSMPAAEHVEWQCCREAPPRDIFGSTHNLSAPEQFHRHESPGC